MNKNIKNKLFLFLFLAIISVFLFKSDGVIGQSGVVVDKEIDLLNRKIENQKTQLKDIQKDQEKYEKMIKEKEKEKNTLENQLEILDNRLEVARLDIEEISLDIDRNNLEIRRMEIDIENKEKEIERDREHISALLRLFYKQGEASPLEIILLNSSLSDFINQLNYLEDTNKELGESLNSLKESKELLSEQKDSLKEKKEKLENLKKELEREQKALENEVANKDYLLERTMESEEAYQELLAEAKRQNDQAMAEIASLEKTVREKLAEKSDDGLEEEIGEFRWPVSKNIITSYFHDPSYPFRRAIGEHSGIDVRAAQGSTLRAASSGYVARVKFNGSTNYAYIMIIHPDNFSTVYGHVSAVGVKEDQYVIQGQTIGRTGGAPRTPGAGPFSTGPHLHFEIRKNGIPVNPLNYLP
jgi:murein DD-endopeptidase MepM/ murein hydrolase activator NlpD